MTSDRAIIATLGNTSRAEVESHLRAGHLSGRAAAMYWAAMAESDQLRAALTRERAEKAHLQRLVNRYRMDHDARYQPRPAPVEGWNMARFAANWGVRAAGLLLVVSGAIGWIVGWAG